MHPLLPALLLALTAVLATPALAQSASGRAQAAATATGGVAWADLNTEQQTALQPLATLWPKLPAEHQRKWLALAHSFDRMTPDEQDTLHSRMAEWARLTPAQRTRARLGFGEVRQLPADEKRAKWEEYQALPAEERDRLAREQPRPPAGAAPALRPAPPSRILRPAVPASAPSPGALALPNPARPGVQVDRNTLLPQTPAAPAR